MSAPWYRLPGGIRDVARSAGTATKRPYRRLLARFVRAYSGVSRGRARHPPRPFCLQIRLTLMPLELALHCNILAVTPRVQ